jgi:hypothetical protein
MDKQLCKTDGYLVTKLIEIEMVERGIFSIKRLHYVKKVTYEYGGLLQVSHRSKHTAQPVEQTPGVLQYK